MSPSSTSSSETTVVLDRFRPWAAIGALALLICFEVVLARRDAAWTLVPNSPTGLVAVQDRVVAELSRPPRVIVLGNSRMIDAVLPGALEAELGLQAGEVLNLALQAGRPFDFLSLSRRHPDLFAAAETIVVGVDKAIFSSDMGSARLRFRFQATLRDRWVAHGERPSLVAGWLVRALDFGPAALAQLRAAVAGRPGVPVHADGRIDWRAGRETIAAEDLAAYDRVILRDHSEVEISSAQVAYLRELVTRHPAARFVYLRPPFRDGFVDRVLEREPEAWRQADRFYEGLGLAPILFSRASEIGLSDRDFWDYGHLTPAGGERFSVRVARLLRDRGS